ncbi:uncharacterized protein LOC134286483 [Aedes albopictus]|uniref:Uncharacterized protein n=1 Tax=Aedes albopictus TaxID=7160 RepID=A0ABM1ZX66_AEDAL
MTTEKPSVASMDLERSEICTCTACENPDVADDLVACDKCDKWWHFTCAGVNESISSRDWICPRCRTPSIPASERSTTSSRRADLQRKRLAEQQELEKKELELERRQLEMQKKHSQEMYELEESLAGDDGDNRSVRSRVNEIEAREKQVEAWVEQNVATGLASTVHPPGFAPLHHQLPKSSDINIVTKNDDEGHNPSHQVPAITVPVGDTNKSSADIPILQSLRSQLAECEQQPVSAERLLNLEAQLRKCRMLISQQEEGAYGGDSIRNSQDRQRSREGALPKIVTNVSDTVGLPKCQVSSVAHSQTRLTGKPNPDLRQSRIEVLQQDSSTGKSRSGPRIRFAPKHIPLGPPLVESTINEQTRLRHAHSNSPVFDMVRDTDLNFQLDAPAGRATLPELGNCRSNLHANPTVPRPSGNVRGDARYVDSSFGFRISDSECNPQWHNSAPSPPHPPQGQYGRSDRFLRGSELQPMQNNLQRPSPEQLTARQVLPRDLPEFSGDPEEWPIFYSSFHNSTTACGFNNVENLARLQRCLKGNALKSVRYYLLSPDSVPNVLETLRTLYGRPEIIINKLIQNVRETPAPKPEKLDSLIDFGISIRNLVQHLIAAGQQAHLSNPALLQELVEKLPANVKLQWAQHLMLQPEASLRTFSDFMGTMVESVSKVVIYTSGQHARSEKSRNKDRSFVNAHSENKTTPVRSSTNQVKEKSVDEKPCLFCGKAGHRLKSCTKFQQLSVEDRWKNVQTLKVCRSCLNPHGRRICRVSSRCGINGCDFRHHQLLHGKPEEAVKPTVSSTENHVHHHCGQSILFRIVPVTLYGKSKTVTVFAFLDEGSSSTLIEQSLARELEIEGPTVPLCLRWTANMTRTEDESQIVSLEVSEMGQNKRFQLMNVRTVDCLNLPSQTLRFTELQQDHPHLKGLPVRSYEDVTPKLLVGLRNLQLAVPLKIKEGNSGIVAARTRLGWCIYGSLDKSENTDEYSYHVCECEAEVKLDRLMQNYFNAEDCAVGCQETLESNEEVRARRTMEETTRRMGDRFETGLLWRSDFVELPDSYPMALRRLECLERRMARDPLLKENIHQQINEYQEKGYAHRATKDELAKADPRRIWYLPLGAVCNPKKPGKVRLIWDAAAKVDGVCLNSALFPGPDLLVPLPSVQFRFRQYPVAVSSDIKEMFHQVRVIERDRPSQCFLFRDSPNDEPGVFMMDVLTFGATSSPSSAQFVKNRNAEEFSKQYPRASEAICKCHYVDDYLDSFESIDEAKSVAGEVRWIHSKGGFELRHWVSNQPAILEYLGEPPKQDIKDLGLKTDSERVLGMLWHTKEDVLQFSMTFREEIGTLIDNGARPTKRQVLKCIMSLFDPLGLLACVLVHGKIMMQDIWRSAIKWDECIDDQIYEKWTRWIELLMDVVEVRVPRCYFDGASTDLYDTLDAHIFVDASEAAYSALVYFRVVGSEGTTKCALVSAKTKVAPLKYVSIPRLELMAAVLGVRLLTFVRENHTVKINRCVYWSDSEVTLAWIRSEHRRYRPFVACRVGEILSTTCVQEWRYVPSKLNVADDATKWGGKPCLKASGRWFCGPPFLQQSEGQWPKQKYIISTDEELRACFLHKEQPVLQNVICFERFSKWNRLLRATAYVIRFITKLKRKVFDENYCSLNLNQEELQAAETLIWKLVQMESYRDEVAIFSKNNKSSDKRQLKLERTSQLWNLSPIMDDKGVLRVDGRIAAAKVLSVDVKFPVILPRKHRVSYLLLDDYHRRLLHGNFETVVNEVRQRFHVSRLRTTARSVINRCQWCRVYKARPIVPMMGPLPAARLSAGIRPFSYVGIDYFGPILVKVGRATSKRWICLITCLTIRAVHVEIAYDLSTKSCIACIRRFVCRRGAPVEIHSDNGRNFIGADRVLRSQIKDIEQKAATTFTNTETKWLFIPPSAPHMGGSWERLVRSIKNAMTSLPQDDKLDDEGLQTLIVEAEAIVNSRPLTYLPLDSVEQEALTPNHFILGSSTGVKQPMVEMEASATAVRTSWEQIQIQIDHFWRRWVLEYLPTLTRRVKWLQDTKPVQPGDLVIVIDETRRNGWLRGRVLDVTVGRDGRVRQVLVQTAGGLFRRPVSKLAVLNVDDHGGEDPTDPHGEGDVETTAISATRRTEPSLLDS